MNDEEFERRLRKIEENPTIRGLLGGGLLKVPSRASLPTADERNAYRMVTVIGTPDVVYVCLRDAGGAWGWEVVATG
ncbi:MAG: hypothetical protein E6Q97_18345 [Desulfurellales bacterium]|nr:MAG: hypothetical protein E6Q97_18345 [Desulfurellales bacterium]